MERFQLFLLYTFKSQNTTSIVISHNHFHNLWLQMTKLGIAKCNPPNIKSFIFIKHQRIYSQAILNNLKMTVWTCWIFGWTTICNYLTLFYSLSYWNMKSRTVSIQSWISVIMFNLDIITIGIMPSCSYNNTIELTDFL